MAEAERTDKPEGALFIMPRPTAGSSGPVAVWVTAAGWAEAARRLWGSSWLITPDGVLTPEQARSRASQSGLRPRTKTWRRFVPKVVKTAAKDVREARKASRFDDSIDADRWAGHNLGFVWQRHDLFHRGGLDLARQLGVPFVLFVDAPVIWEAERWGVHRPGWGSLLERFDENPLFRAADLIACVSDEVADEVATRGVAKEHILVTPCAVDVHAFTPEAKGDEIRRRHGLEDKYVVGWIGSFRQFHGVDLAIEAAAALQDSIPELALLFVGDGSERPQIEERAKALGLRNVVFTGTVEHAEIPDHITAMDVGLVISPDSENFHYSPLKLREYMACGRAVVAPRVGEIPGVIEDGVDGVLVPPGSASALAGAIQMLRDDPELRRSMQQAARTRALRDSSWEQQVLRAYEAVGGFDTAGRV
jgi:glycosyltransferase involved in cell wall biosynthesis